MEEYIDTHCHLDAAEFTGKRADVISDAQQAGVNIFIVPGVSIKDWQRLDDIADLFPGVYTAPGVHPLFIAGLIPTEVTAALEKQLIRPHVVAIGEIGLDGYQNSRDISSQLPFFTTQVELAISARLPILLHIRKAHDIVLSTLRKLHYAQRGCGGVVHAYSGSLQQAEQYYQMGFSLGIGGILCNPAARKIRNIVSQIPIDALVLETDAPYMRLEPKSIPTIVECMAKLREERRDTLRQVITENSRRIFKFL